MATCRRAPAQLVPGQRAQEHHPVGESHHRRGRQIQIQGQHEAEERLGHRNQESENQEVAQRAGEKNRRGRRNHHEGNNQDRARGIESRHHGQGDQHHEPQLHRPYREADSRREITVESIGFENPEKHRDENRVERAHREQLPHGAWANIVTADDDMFRAQSHEIEIPGEHGVLANMDMRKGG